MKAIAAVLILGLITIALYDGFPDFYALIMVAMSVVAVNIIWAMYRK
jgi:hypothetical protein